MLLLSSGFKKTGRHDEAEKIYADGMTLIRENRSEETDGQLQYIIEQQAKLGDAHGAVNTVDEIQAVHEKPYALRLIVEGLLKNGDIENAVSVGDTIDDGYHRAFAHHQIASVQAKDDKEQARANFKVAVDAARSMDIGGGSDVIALYELGRAQGIAGFRDEAAETFTLARERAAKYEDEGNEHIANLLQDVACAQANSGDAERALASSRAETDPLRKVTSLVGSAQGIVARREGCDGGDD